MAIVMRIYMFISRHYTPVAKCTDSSFQSVFLLRSFHVKKVLCSLKLPVLELFFLVISQFDF